MARTVEPMSKASNKTHATTASVEQFLAGLEPERKREDAQALDQLFRKVTGWQPRMWGPGIVGYGEYHYRYDSGREGDYLATGFSPRKANLTIYIMPGFDKYAAPLARLGKHKTARSCLYINKLADVNIKVLRQLIERSIRDMKKRHGIA